MDNPTIAAISTAQGMGGIGVIRISGDDAIIIADKIFKSVSGKQLCSMKGYTAAYGSIVFNDEKIDECIATVFVAPMSYTGENVVELSCHGGIFVTKQVLRAVFESGAMPAQPGEFTKRAFLNSKLDLAQAEAVMNIISAKSRSASISAQNMYDGALSKNINKVKDKLVEKAAHLCAWADYPEEDIREVEFEELITSMKLCADKLKSLLDSFDSGQAIINGIDTAIVGKPNVGKSTLMNLITGYEKSIVTDIPGTTRDIVEQTATIRDIVLHLSDTAGIRDADNAIEKIGVDKAKKKITSSELVIAVFDASLPLTEDDVKILDQISNTTCIAVINKDDLGRVIDVDKIKQVTNNIVFMSAKNNSGVDELADMIENVTGTADFDSSAAVLSNERQRNLAKSAYESIIQATDALTLGMTYDAVTVDIEDAISYLCELTGERVTETVLDSVFHQFCVGK